MHHFRDPCVHCGQAMADVAVGECPGDPAKSVPMSYRALGVRYDGVEHFLVQFSDGRIEERWSHASFHAPYYHFGYSDELTTPPRYKPTLPPPGYPAG
jgi:hypothetical protein